MSYFNTRDIVEILQSFSELIDTFATIDVTFMYSSENTSHPIYDERTNDDDIVIVKNCVVLSKNSDYDNYTRYGQSIDCDIRIVFKNEYCDDFPILCDIVGIFKRKNFFGQMRLKIENEFYEITSAYPEGHQLNGIPICYFLNANRIIVPMKNK